MAFDAALIYAFLLVFTRCSAMLFASPIFGAQNTPLQVRILTTVAISGALTLLLQPKLGPVPDDLFALVGAVFHEIVAGLLIGFFVSLVLQMARIAGALIDIQMGLGISETVNPIDGVSVTVIGQFKYLLAIVLFLSVNGHHTMLQAFAASFDAMPVFGMESLPKIQAGLLSLFSSVMLGAIQIAAPLIAVSLVIDAALGVMNKAVPQMQPLFVGMPAKLAMGMVALGVTLPALAAGVSAGIEHAFEALAPIFGG